jgi:hypothetical protein
MTARSRANVVSSFTVVKGAMIEETYAVFAAWDFERSKRENLDRLREENFIGASSSTWLRDVAKVLNRRFDPNGATARSSCSQSTAANRRVEAASPLAHDARRVPRPRLPRDLALRRLRRACFASTRRRREYLRGIGKRGGTTEHAWSEQTTKRVAAGLLKMAVDFGLLRGSVAKEFASFHLPERSFLYLLHAMREEKLSPFKARVLARLAPVPHAPQPTSSTSFCACTSTASSNTRSPAASCSSPCRARAPASTQRGWLHERPRAPLKQNLEPVLALPDPRPAHQRVPRHAVRALPLRPGGRVRAAQAGDAARDPPLAEGQARSPHLAGRVPRRGDENRSARSRVVRAEREQGTETVVETVHAVLSEYSPLVDLVAARIPERPDPLRDIVFILRTGALFPVYRTFSLLEQLKGRVHVPTVLFYPGDLDGAAGLRFMGVLDAEHNYRPKIF